MGQRVGACGICPSLEYVNVFRVVILTLSCDSAYWTKLRQQYYYQNMLLHLNNNVSLNYYFFTVFALTTYYLFFPLESMHFWNVTSTIECVLGRYCKQIGPFLNL